MKSLKLLAAVAALAPMAFAGAAMAQSATGPQYYGTVGYSSIGADNDDIDADLGSITGRFGARFHPNFAVEGEASFGVKGETVRVGDVDVDVDSNYDAAVYAVGIVPVSDKFELFGRVGYGTTQLEASAGDYSLDDNYQSWNYGVGANYFFDGQNGVRADYTRKDLSDDGGEANAWSLNYVRRF